MAWQEKMELTLRVIEQSLKGSVNPSIAYSGGKDAIVVADILQRYGVKQAIVDTSFYFTKQEQNAMELAVKQGLIPANVRTLEWKHFQANDEVYFPQNNANKYLGIQLRQWKSIPKGVKQLGSNTVFYGRRVGENNAREFINPYPSKGFTAIYPIRLWTTLEVWEYMRDHNLPIPWIYRTMFSQYLNNAPWHTLIGTKLWCWNIVYRTEPRIVLQAANKGLPTAIDYINLPEDSPLKTENVFTKSWFAKESSTISPYRVYGIEVPKDINDGIIEYRK